MDLLDIYIVIYLDNILIYSDNLEDHIKHMKKMLKRLQKNKLYASSTKYAFHQDRIEFLGFILEANGLIIDNSKIQTIQDWLVPYRVKDMQSFLVFVNFYRQFISNYTELTSPLIGLTHKNEPWNWTTDCQLAFNTLKETFITAFILGHWSSDSLMILETDASDCTLAAILFTWIAGEVCPIAFHSRTFSLAEINYDVHDKELLATIKAFKKWRHYLEETIDPVEVFTNHKNLTYFSETKVLSQCQAR